MKKVTRVEYDDGALVNDDCLRLMARMKAKEEKVDLVFGSPPYEDARLYLEDGADLGIARGTGEWVDWMVEVYEASLAVCKGLVAFVVGHGKGARDWSAGPALLIAALVRKKITLRRPVIYQRNGIMGSGTTDWLRADHEWIICATNGPEELPWSDNTACGHPPKCRPGGTPSHRNAAGKRANEGKEVTEWKPPEVCNPGDIIDCGAVGGGNMGSNISHENDAPFPEKLPNFFVRSFCPPGGTVYDPFGGSGTTVAAAIKAGRRFLASDLRPSQIKLMQRRVDQARQLRGFGL